ncbi:hypothetical protein DV702_10440 [Sporosarcina sp. PTS2304]|uniref:GerAB/ArcD/ProY family transporter n=1 Tax=Sporosarcina sp. PTS2304 TaxID=2283194 RepID=UPI000E0D4455|nr:GerAB/ArcD/ProY family transporter [Sporosarcina sp. PTS2304]AXI00096.1 hypothetical protein DV702_10440 [Sporosarcina sp. PTS2304]
MSRFFYYILLSNMIANVIATGPRILFSKSEDGVIVSMILGLFFGVVMNWLFIHSFKVFPGKSLPQILKEHTTKWISIPVLIVLSLFWYVAGLQTLVTYIDLLLHFLTPEMSVYTVFLTFVLIVSFGVLMKSRNILYSLELVLLLLFPLSIYYVAKLYFLPEINWDYIRIAMTYIDNPPDYTAFSTTVYLFIGSFDIIIFNSLIRKKVVFGIKQALFVFALGAIAIFTMYFIPIGILGFDHISDVLYPWHLTSDSIRMKFGVIERVVFLFLFIFLAIAFSNIVIHWHVSFHLLESVCGGKNVSGKANRIRKYILLALFWTVAIIVTIKITEYDLFQLSIYYFNSMLVVIVFLLSLLFILSRRARL